MRPLIAFALVGLTACTGVVDALQVDIGDTEISTAATVTGSAVCNTDGTWTATWTVTADVTAGREWAAHRMYDNPSPWTPDDTAITIPGDIHPAEQTEAHTTITYGFRDGASGLAAAGTVTNPC